MPDDATFRPGVRLGSQGLGSCRSSDSSNQHEAAQVPYAYDASSKLWVSYDDERSFGKKMDFIDEKGLGGAMFWALDMDDYKNGYPLIGAVAKRYKK